MSAEKDNTQHTSTTEHAHEPVNHEAALTGVVALAALFSNCVEAFGLIGPSGKWEKQEQVLLASLGVQQARLLIWGDVLGVTSPPASVTNSAIPKHPSAAYPDVKEPTFFGPRDPRLDETEIRKGIESALSAIVDRTGGASREEMMEKYGLKAPKKFSHEFQPALDTNRLEGFREKYELLREVAETYANINTRRQSSILSSSWTISDYPKFDAFIKLIQEKIDFLINSMDVKERVDRGMRMDIRALGWHLSADRARIALDVSKLKLVQESCKDEYPEYLGATKQALDNIERERRENVVDYNPYAGPQSAPSQKPTNFAPVAFAPRSGRGSVSAASGSGLPWEREANANGAKPTLSPTKEKRSSGLFGGLFKRKSTTHIDKDRSLSVGSDDPPRSFSDAGPVRDSHDSQRTPQPAAPAEPEQAYVRSKSVGDILDAPINYVNEEETRHKLEQLKTEVPDIEVSRPPEQAIYSSISAHDQYHGLGRQDTKTQWSV